MTVSGAGAEVRLSGMACEENEKSRDGTTVGVSRPGWSSGLVVAEGSVGARVSEGAKVVLPVFVDPSAGCHTAPEPKDATNLSAFRRCGAGTSSTTAATFCFFRGRIRRSSETSSSSKSPSELSDSSLEVNASIENDWYRGCRSSISAPCCNLEPRPKRTLHEIKIYSEPKSFWWRDIGLSEVPNCE